MRISQIIFILIILLFIYSRKDYWRMGKTIIIIIENSCVELNKVVMVTDLESKKAIIRNCLKDRRLTE